MKKLAVVADITFLLTFLGLSIYFYKSSGKFRKSIIAAFVAVSFYFSGLKPAHSAGEADAFTPQNQQHQSRPQKEGIFSRKSNNDGPGPGKPNGCMKLHLSRVQLLVGRMRRNSQTESLPSRQLGQWP